MATGAQGTPAASSFGPRHVGESRPYRIMRLGEIERRFEHALRVQHGPPSARHDAIGSLADCWGAVVPDLLDSSRSGVPGSGTAPPGFLPTFLSAKLVPLMPVLWQGGWQPADLACAVTKKLGQVHTRLCIATIAAHSVTYRLHPNADPAWMSQLDELGAQVWWRNGTSLVRAYAEQEGLPPAETVRVAIELIALLLHMPRLAMLARPPQEWDSVASSTLAGRLTGSRSRLGIDPKILNRIRALLAKAESTTFAEEAEAFSAKAQELMSRHAIDHALVQERTGAAEPPTGRRIPVEDPYAAAKAVLLGEVARVNGCKVVRDAEFGFCTILGFAEDIDGVELLFTSLLVQAGTAMLKAGSSGPQARTRSYRQSFLVGFAARIGERLRQAAEATVTQAEAEYGRSLLPVLAGRSGEVDGLFARIFPRTAFGHIRASDRAGWAAGTTAADLASLVSEQALAQAR